MGKKKELTAEQYGAILYGHKRGDSYQKIADNVQCGKTTVHDAIKRFKKTGSAIPKKHCHFLIPMHKPHSKRSLHKIRSITTSPLIKFRNYGLKKKKESFNCYNSSNP